MTEKGSINKSSFIQEAAMRIIIVFTSQGFILPNELINRRQSWIYLFVLL